MRKYDKIHAREKKNLKTRVLNFWKCSVAIGILALGGDFASADPAPNPRSGVNVVTASAKTAVATARNDGRAVRNVATSSGSGDSGTVTGRTAAGTVSRSATSRPSVTVSRSAAAVPTTNRGTTTVRSATARNAGVTSSGTSRAATSRAASSNVVRSANHSAGSSARSAARSATTGASRASMARATAVFDDISKIGGGYAECREAYATCMDQFCANANDTYRRCFCSARYTDFRNTENAINEALSMLAEFENNNLSAVTMTAEEVSAMYSATEGENAIKRDTSAAAAMLSEIGDLLSGNSSASSSSSSGASLSLGIIDFTSDLGDIWGEGGSSVFDNNSGVDLSTLEGEALYNQASRQCAEMVADSCENNAVMTMARSSYGILITQDCNTYEKRINSQKESLEQTIRTAEKYLREARLEEYRSHNSADVNECIGNVRTALLSDVACGPNYEKCMDYTGAYINQSTGEAIYSPRLFELENLIVLAGVSTNEGATNTTGDILRDNQDFDNFLDSRRMFAETALDSCRDIAEEVWEEFKRQALIEIAQAQDEKLEEVRMSCVSTMADCYDTQTGALRDFDTTTAQASGAVGAIAAREMCEDKVIACASLYGNTNGCTFDENGHLENGSDTGAAAAQRCGLSALLAFVDTVDTVRITEGCADAVEAYVTDLCTPTTGDYGFPWNCRDKAIGSIASVNVEEASGGLDASLAENMVYYARTNCMMGTDTMNGTGLANLDSELERELESILDDVSEEMDVMLGEICEEFDGYWLSAGYDSASNMIAERLGGTDGAQRLLAFYTTAYGGDQTEDWGMCLENTTMVQCLNYNDTYGEEVASYDITSDTCTFTDQWYINQCEQVLGGYYENNTCYAPMTDR